MKFILILFLSLSFVFSVGGDRPAPENRNFTSDKVNGFISQMKPKFKNPDLAKIWENCYPNTLDTTVQYDELNQDTFIITGDIEAMWLRDSSFQMLPYLKFAKEDEHLKKMMLYLIRRQSRSILIDPYANAFNKNETNSTWQTDETYKRVEGNKTLAMNFKIWERKYELDSTISTLFFGVNFYQQTGDMSFIEEETWQLSLAEIINLVKKQMRGTDEEDLNGGWEYFFQRATTEPFDSLHQGRGSPVNSCNLVKTMFRSSDDSAMFAYNIPENAFMVTTFEQVADMLRKYLHKNSQINSQPQNNFNMGELFMQEGGEKNGSQNLKNEELKRLLKLKILENAISELSSISKKVKKAIYEHGVLKDQTGEEYFTFEVDCFGNNYFIDDPGYPSLTSLPFFGFVSIDDPIYQNTRKRVLSKRNPYYTKSVISGVEGLASAHTERNYIWPLFSIIRILTSNNEKEILDEINLLVKSAQSTGFIHESFLIDNVEKYTRSWFAWANSFFGYMINQVNEKYPHLLLLE